MICAEGPVSRNGNVDSSGRWMGQAAIGLGRVPAKWVKALAREVNLYNFESSGSPGGLSCLGGMLRTTGGKPMGQGREAHGLPPEGSRPTSRMGAGGWLVCPGDQPGEGRGLPTALGRDGRGRCRRGDLGWSRGEGPAPSHRFGFGAMMGTIAQGKRCPKSPANALIASGSTENTTG